MSVFNLWDQVHNTATINMAVQTTLETQERPARQLSTLVPTTEDRIKLERMEVKAFGLGSFKAIGASSPIYVPKVRYTETEIDLVQLSEQSPVDERLLRRLQSEDENIVNRAGADIALRGKALQIRNENLSDWMVMTAIMTGQLPISFKDEPSQGFVLDYGYLAGHLITAGTHWSNLTGSTPISDLVAMQTLLANDAGEYGVHIWMNDITYRELVFSAEAASLLTGYGRAQKLPVAADIQARMFNGDKVQWHITSSGYRAEAAGYARGLSSLTKWIPDGKVIMTTNDPFEGENLVEQFDGRVLVRTGFNSAELRQGTQSQVKMDDSDTTSWYQTSTRMPRVNRPECIAVLDASG